MNLTSFPPELVGHILSFDVSDVDLRSLWTCGSLRLQHLMSKGMTRFSRVSKEKRSRGALPPFLKNCTSLRFLSIERRDTEQSTWAADAEVLMSLAPSLGELDFRCYSAVAFLTYHKASSPTDSSSSPSDASNSSDTSIQPSGDVLSSLANLHTLKFMRDERITLSIIKRLPQNLSCLSMSLKFSFDETTEEMLAALPRSLLSLEILGVATVMPSLYILLPPNLTRLVFFPSMHPIGDECKRLPRSITHLEFQYSTVGFSSIQSLPPGLRHLTAPICQEKCLDIINDLPKTLTSLSVDDKHPLSLPGIRRLQEALPLLSSLTCGVKLSKVRKGELPSSLTYLSVKISIGPIQWNVLPPGLQHFVVRCTPKPHTAKVMATIRLKHLHTLEFQCSDPNISEWSFPKSITRLVVNGAPFDFGLPQDFRSEILCRRFKDHTMSNWIKNVSNRFY